MSDDHDYLLAEVERLRAALTDVSFRCERCGLDFAADGIDATNRCYQCHNDVHFGQPTVQWNPILDDIGNDTVASDAVFAVSANVTITIPREVLYRYINYGEFAPAVYNMLAAALDEGER